MKIYFTNPNGLMEAELIDLLNEENYCSGSQSDNYSEDSKGITEVIRNENPDVIVHSAEIKNMLTCEDQPREAFKINSFLTRDLAQVAQELDSTMVYISSFHVFSGKKGQAYYEFDRPDPETVYGWSKLWGEYYVSSLQNKFFIIRLPFIFGVSNSEKTSSFNELPLNKLIHEKDSTGFCTDIISNPTWAVHAAKVIKELINSRNYGTYHVGGTGAVSIGQFARSVLSESKTRVLDVKCFQEEGIFYKVMQSAYLPYRSSLIRHITNWRDALKECIQQVNLK